MERRTVLLILTVIILVLEMFLSLEAASITKNKNVCNTKECVIAAATIINNMDDSTDPCDNFFRFACGGYHDTTVIPEDKASISQMDTLRENLNNQLRRLIETPVQDKEPRPFKLVKDLYQSCMNKSFIEEQDLEPLRKILGSLGGWPVVQGSSWNESDFNWVDVSYRFRDTGNYLGGLMNLGVFPELKNTTYNSIIVDQPSLAVKIEYLRQGLNQSQVKAYLRYQTDLAKLLGADPDRAEKEALEALQFEIKLAEISLEDEDRRNFTRFYNPLSVKEMQARWKTLPWLEYINKMLPKPLKVDEHAVVLVLVPEYFDEFVKLMDATPKRIQANYMMGRIADGSVSCLSENARKLEDAFNAAIRGTSVREPRWKECIAFASASMSVAFAAMYVRNNFKEEARQNAFEMVESIKTTFLKNLDAVDWMDEETKQSARKKGTKIFTHIGYPIELLDDAKLEDHYKTLELNNQDYMLNALNLSKFNLDYTFNELPKPVNKTNWIRHGSAAAVNAYYYPTENAIEFPAGILQGVFFNSERPRYLNYGGVGMIIGHEISHALDDMGSQFDEDGSLTNWWDKETKEAYLNRTKCIVEQYGNYTIPEIGMNFNGVLVQGEAIADNSGIKQAYQAYQSWATKNIEEPLLPGLSNYTQNQLFWISSANVWCSKNRVEIVKSRIKVLRHPTGEYRVRGAFSNLESFANDFNCPLGSNMNPVKKCTVW